MLYRFVCLRWYWYAHSAAITINSNRTRRLKHMVRVDRMWLQMRPAFLFTFPPTDCRCDTRKWQGWVDIKGTPPLRILRGVSITDKPDKRMPACQRDRPAVEIWHTDLQHCLCLVLSKHTLCIHLMFKVQTFPTACDWWCHYHHLYPNVARIAKHYLCAPPTSVASERLFSSASRVFTHRRNRLAPKKADMLLFIKHNLPLINFRYWVLSVWNTSLARCA